MGNWKYNLKSGVALRQALADDNTTAVLDRLKDCFIEINQLCPEYYDTEDLEEDLFDIDDLLDSLMNYDEYDMTYDEVLENIDGMLSGFYDLCDNLRIWVGI